MTVGDLGTLEVWRCWRFLPVSLLASSPAIRSRANSGPLGQTFYSLFIHVLFTLLVAQEQDCMCSSRLYACQLSEAFSTEDGDPTLACGCLGGAQHTIRALLFEMSFYNWRSNGLPHSVSGDPWQLGWNEATALVALYLHNQPKFFSNKESQWSFELLILASVTSNDIRICVNVILSWCFLY